MAADYEIGLRGRLENRHDWFPGMRIDNWEQGVILRGSLADQAALHGLLAAIRDLNLELLFVRRLDSPNLKRTKGSLS